MDGRSHVIKPDLLKEYPLVSHGKGIYLYDMQGKRYLDGCSGALVANIGHGNVKIAKAMRDQALKVTFTYRAQFANQPSEELAGILAHLAPGDLNWVFFVNSGSEATETAMKIAIQYWQERGCFTKNRIISRWMSYHGITLGALSMSGHKARRKPFAQLLQDCPVTLPPYCYRCPLGQHYPGCNLLCASELERSIQLIGPENIAAFIFEPVIGASGGAIVPPDGYHEKIAEICRRYDVLLIADEVMTGFGRTGKMFAVEHWGIEPDIMAIGKGLSGGYAPIAATLVSDRILETIISGSGTIMSGHTFSANPLSCAVALAVIKYILDHHLIEKAGKRSQYLEKKLYGLVQKHPHIGDIRGLGLMWGIELVKNCFTGEPFDNKLDVTGMVINQAMQNGLIIYNASGGFVGPAGATFMIAPPLTITKKEINTLVELLDLTLSQVYEQLVRNDFAQLG
ncbi:MAG: aspartate aminotransferase family protein [Peptococcaceae bacterium]|nr:aspartate aminotransferase family protein [Peptococcaceae bacterium]